jgi:chromosomal replication initiation ATPase DnaA
LSRPEQLVLDLPTRPALGRAAFFVAPANRLALALVESWPAWPGGRLAVTGPAGAGKTHLAHVWAARTGARIVGARDVAGLDLATLPGDAAVAVEDADRLASLRRRRAAAEEAFFHLCNHLASGGGSLLVSGRRAPTRWTIRLPDLASRLGAATVAKLEAPDDALLAALLVKHFADRQVAVAPGLIDYLVPRIERSSAAAEAVVAALDRAGLAGRRPLTPRLAAEVLQAGQGG